MGLDNFGNAVAKFHSENYVHGDLREPNILIDSSGQLLAIDFDWAGKQGTVVYPVTINDEITWPVGVEGGEKIRKEHDQEMLAQLLAIFRQQEQDAMKDVQE